jgi:AcrR family transcriptional regulator
VATKSTESQPTGRPWRGESAESRRSRRREQLIEAGVELFGTRGYARSSVKSICDEAGLTERYFYETFPDREGLLIEIYREFIDEAITSSAAAVAEAEGFEAQIRDGLTTFARTVATDPRRARIQQIEVVGVSETLEERRRDALNAFAALIADRATAAGVDAEAAGLDMRVLALGLVGSINETLVDYVAGRIDVSLESLVEHQVAIFMGVTTMLIDGSYRAGP